jgi:mannitol/fructose-specific phosphotransferase system IIA component
MTKNPIRFGAKIFIGPKSLAFQDEESVQMIIGIGKDHVAHLEMNAKAYKALLNGEEATVTTAKEYADKYIKKQKTKKEPSE